jgi:hypothetical protein
MGRVWLPVQRAISITQLSIGSSTQHYGVDKMKRITTESPYQKTSLQQGTIAGGGMLQQTLTLDWNHSAGVASPGTLEVAAHALDVAHVATGTWREEHCAAVAGGEHVAGAQTPLEALAGLK